MCARLTPHTTDDHLQLRYANNSNYKNDTMIRKECFVSQAVLDELKRIIEDSEVGLLRAVKTLRPTLARY